MSKGPYCHRGGELQPATCERCAFYAQATPLQRARMDAHTPKPIKPAAKARPPARPRPGAAPPQPLPERLRPAPRVALPCVHLGPPTGESLPCPTCTGTVSVPLRACAVRGVCTETRLVKDAEGRPVASCPICPDRRPPDAAAVHVSADGIGDAVVGLTLAARWGRDNPGRGVALVAPPRALDWLRLFEGYDHLATDLPAGMPLACDLSARGGLHYVEAAARLPRTLPWPRPLPAAAVAWARPYRGAVALCPWGLTANRNWPLAHWLELERLLLGAGLRCVVLDGGAGRDRGRNRGFASPVVADEPPARVAAVLCGAAAVAGNESGLAHVAGALRAPSVVAYAQLDAAPIYAPYPEARLVRGPLGCSGCRWAGPDFRPACRSACASLAEITPAEMAAALHAATRPLPGLLRDPAADRALDSLARAVDSRRWELGQARGIGRALARLARSAGPAVVETGCQRADDDYGAGMSTTVFGRFLQAHGGRLTSLDLTPAHAQLARDRARGLPVEVVETDSRPWLAAYSGPPLALAYLDSHDMHLPGHAECCLEEARLVAPRLAPGGAVLVDDTWLDGGRWRGKGALAVPWLLSRGFRLEWHGYQALLAAPS